MSFKIFVDALCQITPAKDVDKGQKTFKEKFNALNYVTKLILEAAKRDQDSGEEGGVLSSDDTNTFKCLDGGESKDYEFVSRLVEP